MYFNKTGEKVNFEFDYLLLLVRNTNKNKQHNAKNII